MSYTPTHMPTRTYIRIHVYACTQHMHTLMEDHSVTLLWAKKFVKEETSKKNFLL